MDNVIEKVCEERHRSINEKINNTIHIVKDNTKRIESIEEAVIKLTYMADRLAKKDIFDKALIVSVYLISIVLVSIILGPEIVSKILK